MTSRRFQQKKENFACFHCGNEVHGDGYTNHCPRCLWSLHVDINPGDRAAACGALMRPIKAHLAEKDRYLVHRCESCEMEKKNRLHKDDSIEELTRLVREGSVELV